MFCPIPVEGLLVPLCSLMEHCCLPNNSIWPKAAHKRIWRRRFQLHCIVIPFSVEGEIWKLYRHQPTTPYSFLVLHCIISKYLCLSSFANWSSWIIFPRRKTWICTALCETLLSAEQKKPWNSSDVPCKPSEFSFACFETKLFAGRWESKYAYFAYYMSGNLISRCLVLKLCCLLGIKS